MIKKIHLIGNAHLDPVWLWQWQEGFAEVKATFRSALDRMKEFDDFKFTSACSFYYMWVEKIDPEMFAEIQQRVKEGRWNIVGGWGIQPDCNLPCGEAFARHSLVSQRYFKEKFGVTANVGYNVDSFGHNGGIPKILKNSGMDNYVFMRPGPHEKELPASLFKWESMDGSCVTAYRIPEAYCIIEERFGIFETIDNLDKDIPMMAFYGCGNHGGGPTIALLEKMHEVLDERHVYSTPSEYFKEVEKLDIPVVKGDLQFHAKGCYSACSKVKTGNRLGENKLLEAEKYSALSNELMGTEYPADELKKAWNNVLFNQFHDILGGCSIKDAYDDAGWMHGEAINIANRTSNFALQQISWNIDTNNGMDITNTRRDAIWVNQCLEGLGIPVVVFNSLPFPVKHVLQIHYPATMVKTNDGKIVPVQKVRAQKTCKEDKWEVAFPVEAPALGYSIYRLHITEAEEHNNPFVCTDSSIENEKIRVSFNKETGELSGIFLKESGKELLSDDSRTVLVDEITSDTWGHGIEKYKDIVGVFDKGSIKLMESGPVRATIRSVMKMSDTEIIRDYTIESGSDVVSVKAKIDFREKHKMLKFCIPAAVENPKAYGKIPFGFIERPVNGDENHCGEWIAICDDKSGVVIANSDKYSFDADKNVLSLTVLRGAVYADHCFGDTTFHDDRCEFMDMGEHEFKYTISPFESISRAEREGEQLNNPLTYVNETFHRGKLSAEYSGIEVSEENIVVTAIKKYEDGDGWVVRCYETEDKDTDVEITLFGTKWQSKFSHSEVKTFIVQNSEVSEADFMEWK